MMRVGRRKGNEGENNGFRELPDSIDDAIGKEMTEI